MNQSIGLNLTGYQNQLYGPNENLYPRKASMSNEALIKEYRCSSVRHVIIHGARAWARVT